jgi:Tfp pilus assembly protein PilF
MMLPVAVAFAAVAFLTATVLFGRQWQHRQQQIGKSREAVERANELMRKGDAQSAVAELQEAIRLNEANAKAYGVLAHALNKQRAGQPPREGGESASVTAARRGVALDRTCADCHGTLGLFLFMHDWKWREAETHLREAIRLGPAEEGIRPSYAIFLAATGRQAEALKEIDVAIAARPYEISWHSIRASIFYFDRRYVEALDAADRGLSLSATERSLWEWRAKALFMLGRGEEAVRALAQDTFASQSPELDRAVRDGGVDGGLRKLLAITDDWRSRVDHAWRRAGWRAMLGDQAGTFEEIEHAFDARIFPVIYIGVDPVYDLIRNDPRYARLLARVGLDQVLEASAGRPRRPPLPRG